MSDAMSRPSKRPHPHLGREDFAPALVHELRQPLTGVDAGLRLVERELGTSVTSLDGWRIATGQLARLQETLEEYRQLLDPGCAERATFAVAPVVQRAVDDLRFRLDALGDRFGVVAEGGVPPAWGSPGALHHALTNLLANAIDAVDEAGNGGRIEIRVLRVAGPVDRAQVRVADAGVGIAPARRSGLFTDGVSTKPRGKGSGIGLALARRLVRSAGGELCLAADDDPARRPWSETELVVDLAASADSPVPLERPPRRALAASRAAPAALLAAVLLVTIALGWLGFKRWVRAGDVEPSSPAAEVSERVEVLQVDGQVERQRPDGWEPVATGQVLRVDDTIRAGSRSGVTLAIGGRSRLTLSETTQLTVREITAAVQRLRLSRGRISVDHQPDGSRVLVLESERGDAVARAGTARFSALASGTALAVATETGIVRLQSGGRAVDVAAGRQAVSFRGQPPSPSAAIPAALLLKIARGGARQGECLVAGTVAPGSEVRVDGRPVEAGPDGRFTVRVPRDGRTSAATVRTRDAAGRFEERRIACAERDHDVSEFSVRWGRD